jgi:hypothetical protein
MEFPSALDPLRSLKAVWRAVRASPGAIAGWWGIGLGGSIAITLVFYACVFVLAATGGAASEGSREAGMVFGGVVVVLAIGFGVALFVVQCWWRVGLENVLADTLRTGRSQLADAWNPRGRVTAVIGTHLFVGLSVCACYLPLGMALELSGLLGELFDSPAFAVLLGVPLFLLWLGVFAYVILGLLFAPFAAALEPLGSIEAVRRSWGAARGKRIALLVFWIVTTLFALAGFLLLCVGYLATASLVFLMPAEAWLALTRGEERKGWWISGDTNAGQAGGAVS